MQLDGYLSCKNDQGLSPMDQSETGLESEGQNK